jgi:hypothetical protein
MLRMGRRSQTTVPPDPVVCDNAMLLLGCHAPDRAPLAHKGGRFRRTGSSRLADVVAWSLSSSTRRIRRSH